MFYLFLSIISSVLIAVVIRLNESRDLNRLSVMFFNYLTATILAVLIAQPISFSRTMTTLVPLSMLSGLFFVSAFLVYMKTVRLMGLAIPVTVTRISVVVPVVGSMLFFAERVNGIQTVGLLLAAIAIYLFSYNPKPENSGRHNNISGYLLALLLWLLIGCGDFTLKVFQETYSFELMSVFVMIVFAFATVFTLLPLLVLKIRPNRDTALAGVILGIPNFFSAYFIVKALNGLPGTLAFPLNSIGIILLSALTGYLFWQERFTFRIKIAFVIATASVVFLNLSF